MYPYALFTLFGVSIDLYTVCVTVGIVGCLVWCVLEMKRKRFSADAVEVYLMISLLSVAIGFFFAVLFQSVYDFIADPSAGFAIGSRMTFLGGLIGGSVTFLALYFLYVKWINPRTTIKWLKSDMNASLCDLLDFIPVCLTFAHCFGRAGCFFAGCCYGKPTDAWFGVQFVTTVEKVIPTQLFESAFLLVLCAVMALLYYRWRFSYNFSLYLISYGVFRFVIEFFRADDRGALLGVLSPSQFWSVLLVLLGVGYGFLYRFFLSSRALHPERKI